MKILVIDVGGNNVKMLATGQIDTRRVASGPSIVVGVRLSDGRARPAAIAAAGMSAAQADPVENGRNKARYAPPGASGQGHVTRHCTGLHR